MAPSKNWSDNEYRTGGAFDPPMQSVVSGVHSSITNHGNLCSGTSDNELVDSKIPLIIYLFPCTVEYSSI